MYKYINGRCVTLRNPYFNISLHQKPDKYTLLLFITNLPQIIVVNFCQNCGFIEISISSRISMSPGLQTY